MRQTPDAIANTVMTTIHFRPVPSISRINADRAVTTPSPSAMFAAKALPSTTPAPPRSAANEAGQPESSSASASTTTATI